MGHLLVGRLSPRPPSRAALERGFRAHCVLPALLPAVPRGPCQCGVHVTCAVGVCGKKR